ncbi:ANTAR domain-containing protein [Motilibacter peucedani]|uniref:ANTAR domain-containing protein n=2 Tax=Motilibacter peucedani TaxID=598650 RepID=A0A420XKH7_9ACTN|nr:ANTAR domain-containing protein [Motilibacter peucedani]
MAVPSELVAVFARMNGLLISSETVDTALRLVTVLALEAVPGASGVGITLVDRDGTRQTAAATGPDVERADELQYDLDEGPCLAAYRSRTMVRVDDTATDRRWPRWAARAQDIGFGSALSTPLVAGDVVVGVIKVYAAEPGALGDRAAYLLGLFSVQAALLLANVQAYDASERLSEGLKDALRARELGALARGILMSSRGLDEAGAFAELVSMANQEHRPVESVARALVESTARRER